jgi:heme-degrading monooxygenase HmoA
MIVEHAEIVVPPERGEDFRAALGEAAAVVRQASGFRWIEFHQSVENPDTYCIRIGWTSLSDHLDGFRTSPLFTQWRAVIGPYFEKPPHVEHYRPLQVAVVALRREDSGDLG